MKPTIPRKRFSTEEDIAASSPEELMSLILEKQKSNPDGWTKGAGVSDNLRRLHEGEWSKEELKIHRSGKPRGSYGVARNVVKRLAPSCPTLVDLIAAMKREKGADREIVDIAEGEVSFNDKGRMLNIVSN